MRGVIAEAWREYRLASALRRQVNPWWKALVRRRTVLPQWLKHAFYLGLLSLFFVGNLVDEGNGVSLIPAFALLALGLLLMRILNMATQLSACIDNVLGVIYGARDDIAGAAALFRGFQAAAWSCMDVAVFFVIALGMRQMSLNWQTLAIVALTAPMMVLVTFSLMLLLARPRSLPLIALFSRGYLLLLCAIFLGGVLDLLPVALTEKLGEFIATALPPAQLLRFALDWQAGSLTWEHALGLAPSLVLVGCLPFLIRWCQAEFSLAKAVPPFDGDGAPTDEEEEFTPTKSDSAALEEQLAENIEAAGSTQELGAGGSWLAPLQRACLRCFSRRERAIYDWLVGAPLTFFTGWRWSLFWLAALLVSRLLQIEVHPLFYVMSFGLAVTPWLSIATRATPLAPTVGGRQTPLEDHMLVKPSELARLFLIKGVVKMLTGIPFVLAALWVTPFEALPMGDFLRLKVLGCWGLWFLYLPIVALGWSQNYYSASRRRWSRLFGALVVIILLLGIAVMLSSFALVILAPIQLLVAYPLMWLIAGVGYGLFRLGCKKAFFELRPPEQQQ